MFNLNSCTLSKYLMIRRMQNRRDIFLCFFFKVNLQIICYSVFKLNNVFSEVCQPCQMISRLT